MANLSLEDCLFFSLVFMFDLKHLTNGKYYCKFVVNSELLMTIGDNGC